MASFFGMANPIDDIKGAITDTTVRLTEYISGLEKKDIDNIFNNTNKTPAGHIEFFTGEEWLTLDAPHKRRAYAASTLIIARYSTCDIEEVKSYLKSFDEAHKTYIGKDSLDYLIKELEQMKLNGGGRKKQTGGGFAEIAQLLAGLDVIVLKMINQRGMDVEIIDTTINGTIMLLDKAAMVISNLPACMKSLLGDTLYRLMHRLATSIIGYKITAFTWEHKKALISILGKILSYAPAVASGTIALIIGFVATKVMESAAATATAVEYEANLKAALNTLDAATVTDIVNIGVIITKQSVDLTKKFFDLSAELVIRIRKQLADARDETVRMNIIAKANKKADMESDWAALLAKTELNDLTSIRALNETEKVSLNNLFNEQFEAIQNAIRMSPEYIAAAELAAARTAAQIAEVKFAEETMARELEAGDDVDDDAAMEENPSADEKDNKGAGAEQGAKRYRGEEENQSEEDDEGAVAEQVAKKSRVVSESRRAAEEVAAKRGKPDYGGKRKSQKQQQKQKQQKKTQKQSHKKLSKSNRAKKAKQSKKANKKH